MLFTFITHACLHIRIMLSLTLRETIARLKDGSICAKELCEKCIERSIKTRELNAVITPTYEAARKQAEVAAATWSRTGKHPASVRLDGIPVGVKDNFCTDGVRTTCASKMLEDYVPPYNATVVQRLIDHGAIMLGKLNMDEYAMGVGSVDGFYGPVKNPWKYNFSSAAYRSTTDLESSQDRIAQQEVDETTMAGDWYVTGGSSGGSAVAVATGMCFGALASDTGGSTRVPASHCGVVGLKSSYGLLSRHGLIPLTNSLDVPGIISKTVDDANILQNILAGHDSFDSTTITDKFVPSILPDEIDVKHLHIGIPKEYHPPGLCPQVLEAWDKAADMFEKAGAKVTEVSLPHSQYSIDCYTVLCCCDVASNMARYDGVEYGHRANTDESTEEMYAVTRHEGFNDVVRGRIFAGNYFLLRRNYEKFFLKAQKVRRLIAEDFRKVYDGGVDVLLTPTMLTAATQYKWFIQEDNRTRCNEQDIFTQPVNLAGLPAVSIPGGVTSDGLPVGLQLIGQTFKDKDMLLAAKWLELQIRFTPLNLDFLDEL